MLEDFLYNLRTRVSGIQLPPELKQRFEGFLSNLGASTRKTVAVAFSQNIGLEMIEIDNLAGKITKYATRPLGYDSINRRMESYTEFAKALMDLFEEFDISTNSNVILTLPNILFGLMDVPSILHGDNIRNVILSEVEQSYIFKSNEPLVSWCNLSKNRRREKDKPNSVLYSAIQKDVIENVLEACQVVGCRFLTIESSHLSTLRGLSFLGLNAEQVKENSVWQVMIVDVNVFSIITMQGSTPIKYFEEPLALKSFDEDEIYKAIASSAMENLTSDNKIKSKDLFIISQTDLINAESLKNEIHVTQRVEVLNCNKYSQIALYPTGYEIDPEVAEQISLNAIGSSAFLFYHYPIYLNYIKETVEERESIDDQIGNIKVNLGNIELNITKNTIRRLAFMSAMIVLLPLFIVYILLGQIFLPMEQDKAKELMTNIEVVNKQIKELTEAGKQTKFDINTAIKENVKNNKEMFFKYSAIAEITPKNLWITNISEERSNIILTGVSSSTHTIYEFYQNLKKIMNNNTLVLNKLELTQDVSGEYLTNVKNIPNELYRFEIANSKTPNRLNTLKQAFHLSEQEDTSNNTDENTGTRVTVSSPVPDKMQQAPTAEESEQPNEQQEFKRPGKRDSSLPIYLKKIEDF